MSLELFGQLVVNSLITGSTYALVSAGLALSYGLLRILNFSHGHLMMVGAYAFLFFSEQQGMSLLPAALCTAATTGILGIVCLWIFIQPFMKNSYHLPIVTTLALATILEASVSLIFGVNVKSLWLGTVQESIDLGGVFITPVQITIIVSSLVILGGLGAIIHCTSIGRHMRALRENKEAALGIGIPAERLTATVFALATIVAAFAGVMVGLESNLQPTMGNAYTMKAFAAMILGGLGNFWGTIAGAYILGFIENISIGVDFFGYSLPAGYKDAFAYVIILGMLLIKPVGLFGVRHRAI